jgi:hypothetical protein
LLDVTPRIASWRDPDWAHERNVYIYISFRKIGRKYQMQIEVYLSSFFYNILKIAGLDL